MPFYFLLLLVLSVPLQAAQLAGRNEIVVLPDYQLAFDAKLDTGADHSSLHVEHWEIIADKVRFELRDKFQQRRELELPLLRIAQIRQQGQAPLQRPVVQLKLCLGTISKAVEVNLADRRGYRYPLLLGRSFLQDDFVVDAAVHYQLHRCEGAGRD